MSIVDFVIPVFIFGVMSFGMYKKVDVFDSFVDGARGGVRTTFNVLPSLVLLMVAIKMFQSSGALEYIVKMVSPITSLIGMPDDLVPLVILRPISGSGSLAIVENILKANGPDSLAGRIASVMMGSTETTFYTIAVYYGAIKVKNTSYTLPSALIGDIAGFIASTMVVRYLFG